MAYGYFKDVSKRTTDKAFNITKNPKNMMDIEEV